MNDLLDFALFSPFQFGGCCAVLGLLIIGFSTASPATRWARPFGISLFAASILACLVAWAVSVWMSTGSKEADYDVIALNKFYLLLAFSLAWLLALPISFIIAITPLKPAPPHDP